MHKKAKVEVEEEAGKEGEEGNANILYTVRMKREEIRGIQIKYARTPLTHINEERVSAVLMTEGFHVRVGSRTRYWRCSLLWPTPALTCVSALIRIFYVKKYRDHTQGFACSTTTLSNNR